MENREGLKLIFYLSNDHIYSKTDYNNLTFQTLLDHAALNHRLSIMPSMTRYHSQPMMATTPEIAYA